VHRDSPTNDRPPVLVFGVLPPPVTGMTLCTEAIADFLQRHHAVQRFNLSDGSGKISWTFRLRKFGRTCVALGRLLISGKLSGAVLYMPLNSGFAMYYNVAAAFIARIRGWRTVVHHHTYFYLVRYDWRVKVLDRLIARKGLHLALCCHMRERLMECYNLRAPFDLLPSTVLLAKDVSDGQSASQPQYPPIAPQRLGHISNLSPAKGTLLALETFAKLREEGHDVRLIVAGPIMEPTIADQIQQMQKKFGDSFDYRGPVYGAAKHRFFEDIDVLLFPSQMEAQPLVLSEAFAYAKPALARSISCIPSLIGTEKWHVPLGENYVSFAADRIKRWRGCPEEFAAARQFAHQRVAVLKADAQSAMQRLSQWLDDRERRAAPAEPALSEQALQSPAVAKP
jgi:glycosyltransferase involved in cell wall biosynthesis